MRKIKFRFWDTLVEKMFTMMEFAQTGMNLQTALEGTNIIKVMQYTGLKDNSGVEIYEDDIIWDAHAEIHGKVIFDEGAYQVEWDTHIEDLFEVVVDGYAEVVGNIYQNPELLEDKP